MSATKHHKKPKHSVQSFKLEKGLDPKEAFRRAKNRATRDFRGFNYNSKTGLAKLI